jgi:hypothetical protein
MVNKSCSKSAREPLTSRSSVSAVRSQYFIAMKGLNSKSSAFAEISFTLIGFEICSVDPAMVDVYPAVNRCCVSNLPAGAVSNSTRLFDAFRFRLLNL